MIFYNNINLKSKLLHGDNHYISIKSNDLQTKVYFNNEYKASRYSKLISVC